MLTRTVAQSLLSVGARVSLGDGRAGVVAVPPASLVARVATNPDAARFIYVLADDDIGKPNPEQHYITVPRETLTVG